MTAIVNPPSNDPVCAAVEAALRQTIPGYQMVTFVRQRHPDEDSVVIMIRLAPISPT